MDKEGGHIFSTELECATSFDFTVDAMDLLTDIKVLIKEYYLATFCESGDSLNIKFNNGQTFKLSIVETTQKSA